MEKEPYTKMRLRRQEVAPHQGLAVCVADLGVMMEQEGRESQQEC